MTNTPITKILSSLLGLNDETTHIMSELIDRMGYSEETIKYIEKLPDHIQSIINKPTTTDGSIDYPNDPDNTHFDKYHKQHNVDGWDPETDKSNAFANKQASPNVATSDEFKDFNMKNESNDRINFLDYMLSEQSQAQIDSTIIDAGNDIDSNIDDQTKRKIDSYTKQGNTAAADRLRVMALRKNKINTAKPKTPVDAMVNAKKKQLAQALQTAERHSQRNGDE